MSSSAGGEITDVDAGLVSDMAVEPSYFSEIARKLRRGGYPMGYNKEDVESDTTLDRTWDMLTPNAAVRRVSKTAFALTETNPNMYEIVEVGYDTERSHEMGESQSGASTHLSFSQVGYTEEDKWRPYKVIHNVATTSDDIGSMWDEWDRPGFKKMIQREVDPSVTVEDKKEVVKLLSRSGNDMSKYAELIMQDVFERQFSRYGTPQVPVKVVYGDYNDPGEDFYFEDIKDERAIQVEISTRYENPIGQPYVDTKTETAYDLESDEGVAVDVLIMAPDFTHDLMEKYGEDDRMVLAEVPNSGVPTTSRYMFKEKDRTDVEGEGSPIIAPDGSETSTILREEGHVGNDYPVVDGFDGDYEETLKAVGREFDVVTESRYRNMIREASEPLLDIFNYPYRIEQFLLDMYWDKGLTQSAIGNIIGAGQSTISDWMNDQHWGIVTRGTGTYLSDETKSLWEDMYGGEEPFPNKMSGYDIKYLYNMHPTFDREDWSDWFGLDPSEREEQLERQYPSKKDVTYTIMLGKDERIFPSYSFIMTTLDRMGVDIREGMFGSGSVIATGLARGYMLNEDQVRQDSEGSVLYLKSGLENSMAEWLSQKEVPFAYEPINIPGTFVENEYWDEIMGRVDDPDDDLMDTWEEIYMKHELGEEGDVGVEEGIELFNKGEIVPDFTIYPDEEEFSKGRDWEGWGDFEYMIELAGPYGAGIVPDTADWDDWYRVSGVAYKELLYRLLGIWDDILFIVPNSESVGPAVRTDDHYVVINSTQEDAGYDKLEGSIGVF